MRSGDRSWEIGLGKLVGATLGAMPRCEPHENVQNKKSARFWLEVGDAGVQRLGSASFL
jgi:hypothetical protein